MSIFGALFWFLIGAATVVSFGVDAIRTGVDDITTQFCEILPIVCDLLSTRM